jgi:hypothetical protein
MMGWMAPCGISVPKCWSVENHRRTGSAHERDYNALPTRGQLLYRAEADLTKPREAAFAHAKSIRCIDA